MKCAYCHTQYEPPKNNPGKRFCTRLCRQLSQNVNKKAERRKAWGAEGMDSSTFRVFVRDGGYAALLEDNPQRKRIEGIEVPPIPLEYKFLYGAPMRPMRLAEKFLPEQKEMRAAAVRTMVAMGKTEIIPEGLRDSYQEIEGMHNESGVW